MNRANTRLEELNQWMRAHQMHGYWMQEGGGTGTQVKPYLWKWADMYQGLVQAGTLVPVGPSGLTEMRTIGLVNPEQRGVPGSISLSPQILMPGERTRAHRNLKNETRFVIQAPPGAVFVADGEAFPMEAGDLVVSPTGSDHDHFNAGSEPAIWLDGLDMGLLNLLGTEINERYPVADPYQVVDKPAGYFAATRDRMKDSAAGGASRRPPLRYPWSDTSATLTALRDGEVAGDPYDGILLRFTSPVDGGPTLPTFSCEIQLLTSGLRTGPHRHNSTAIYAVVRGEGQTEVAGERLEWTQGDIFCVPPWTWHYHENLSHADAILYSIDDWPAMVKMGFYRTEAADAIPE
jgi:1-hydroxy-2-naphthoate dioxygenase